ncbi:MAG: ABC transporter permease subunit [Gammaproteobacteria bacterium]|nr:ABC transporter permease subunit [Gammaproteobacteria bacterium]MBU1656377.1 ABC transporter permease subunit [Gammaproteobacteria bacterium]MBU1962133.1 ABC transporter permease subunit [Gammaproteobacteria bacterium]
MTTPRFLGIHARPGKLLGWALAALPFLLALGLYLWASDIRHRDNPNDKLLPTPAQMVDAAGRMAFEQDRRTGTYPMARDTISSLKRLLTGVALAASAGLLLGLNMGLFPGMGATLSPFVTFLSMIPPLAILPILFISFGVDELAKVMLIFIGLFPLIARDMQLAVRKLPGEQITKALTLGASQLELAYRIVLPQILPRLIETVRLSLGAAWLFLIAAEAIAADDGLGYRIFLVRRYLAMDIILPYVLWITLIGYLMDLALRYSLQWAFPWYGGNDDE